MRHFFKNTSYVFQVYFRGNKLNILLVLFVYYYYYLLLIKQIFVSFFIVLKYILNKPQKSHKVFILFNHKIIIKVVVEEKIFIQIASRAKRIEQLQSISPSLLKKIQTVQKVSFLLKEILTRHTNLSTFFEDFDFLHEMMCRSFK